MQILFGILLMFTGAASGVLFQDPVVCTSTESKQCYVAVGQQLHLQMPQDDIFNLLMTDKSSTNRSILRFRINSNTSPTPPWQFVNDKRTLILTSAERSDSGIYTLEIFERNGRVKKRCTFQVNVEAAVSSVTLSYSCLFPEVRKVYCSAYGDDLRFGWTSEVITRFENNNRTLVLDKYYDKEVTCHVENHVSREARPIELQTCPDVLLPVLSSISVILLLLSVLAFCIYKKRQALKNKEASSQDDKKVVYADITHLPKDRTETKPRTPPAQDQNVEYGEVVHHKQKEDEDEVQYGDLVFHTSAQKNNMVPKRQEESVYAEVQHGQRVEQCQDAL